MLAGVPGTLFSQRQQTDIGQQFFELAVQTTDKLDRSLFERFREVQILAMLVGSLGYDTRIAYDGETALDYARTALPAICLLDIGMPGMNGYALVRHLREIPGMRGALIVAVTGYGQADDRALALDSGFDDHMTKPVDLDRQLPRLAAADPERAAPVTNR